MRTYRETQNQAVYTEAAVACGWAGAKSAQTPAKGKTCPTDKRQINMATRVACTQLKIRTNAFRLELDLIIYPELATDKEVFQNITRMGIIPHFGSNGGNRPQFRM